jgi:acetyl esterase
MSFDPVLAQKLHLMENINFHALDADALTRMDEFYRDPEPWSAPADVEISEDAAPGPHGLVPLRVYRPSGPVSGRGLVWAHGGGFASGDLDMGEAHIVSAELASRSGAVVISVGYRLAVGGVRHPVPVDDVHAAALWALDGGASAALFSIGGASAGAALALATAQRLVAAGDERLTGLLLAYPFAHFPNPALDSEVTSELAILPSSLRFPAANIEWMVQNYTGSLCDVSADAMPGGGRMTGLPPASIVVSEYDDLRSSAELLERQFTAAQVPVTSYLAKGMPHGHLNRSPVFAEVEHSLEFFAQALRS